MRTFYLATLLVVAYIEPLLICVAGTMLVAALLLLPNVIKQSKSA